MAQPQFSQIVASAARESIVSSNLSSSVSIPGAGGTETIDVYAPSGCICKLNLFSLYVLPLSGGGTHSFVISSTDNSLYTPYLAGQSNAAAAIQFSEGEWTADFSKSPANNSALVMLNITFDNVVGMRLKYTNNTGAAQINPKNIFVQYTKRVVG